MLGVDGNYLFDCSIDGLRRDFIEWEDQFIFEINEYAGNVMPDFKMVFVSKEEKLMTMLHEGTLLKGKIGRTYETLQDMQLYVSGWDSAKHSESHRLYIIHGFASPLTFACDPNYQITPKQSSVATILATAKKTFKQVISNIQTSSDSQRWIQPHMSDREFIQKTLYRADLGASFPACAITLDGKFILKDIKADLKDPQHDWKLVRNSVPKNKNEVTYNGDAAVTSNSGIINKILGYGFDLESLYLDTEKAVTAKIASESILANSSKVGGLTNAKTNKLAGLQHTDNVHANYNKAYYHNLTQLLSLSRVELHATVDGRYYPFKPLDKIMLSEADIVNSKLSAEYHSGMYYCSFISRTIQTRQMMTTLKFNRESVNKVK